MKYAGVSLPIAMIPARSFEYEIPPELEGHVRPGSLVWVPFHNRKKWGIVETVSEVPEFKGAHRPLAGILPVSNRAIDTAWPLIQKLSQRYFTSPGLAARTALPISTAVAASKGFERTGPVRTAEGEGKIEPAEYQKAALEAMLTNASDERRPVYCWGPTGSGKTYVLLAFICEMLKRGRSCLYLVPEIALTPQFLEIFIKELPKGTQIACWSSGLRSSERQAIWRGVEQGSIRLVLGTRSAAFLPMKELGAIIVDEEQDASFKQEQPPSYHAREIAVWRAQTEGATAVMASATPSLECYRMIQEGGMLRVDLGLRYHQKEPVQFRVTELASRKKILADVVVNAIQSKIALGYGAIVFHNRRGAVRGLRCARCQNVILCGQCDLPLVLHKSGEAGESRPLRCHHCGIRKNQPQSCPKCGIGAEHLESQSFGTQQIERDLQDRLGVRILRLDKDTSKEAKTIYDDFKAGQAPVLIGTQLVTKGWHFPNVGLVAVLDADTEMTMPDFRACERTFQTLVQVAGRTGRAGIPGEVLVATRHPNHYIFESLSNGDWESFYRRELELRRQMLLPPFTRLLTLELKGKNREDAAALTESLKNALLEARGGMAEANKEAMEILGSAPGFFQKIRGLWRFQITLRIPEESAEAWNAITRAVAAHKKSKITIRLHLDPYRLL